MPKGMKRIKADNGPVTDKGQGQGKGQGGVPRFLRREFRQNPEPFLDAFSDYQEMSNPFYWMNQDDEEEASQESFESQSDFLTDFIESLQGMNPGSYPELLNQMAGGGTLPNPYGAMSAPQGSPAGQFAQPSPQGSIGAPAAPQTASGAAVPPPMGSPTPPVTGAGGPADLALANEWSAEAMGTGYDPAQGAQAQGAQAQPGVTPHAPVQGSNAALSVDELVDLAQMAGFTGEGLKNMVATIFPESGGRPAAHNPNAGTGDNSYGLAQINMLGNLGPDRLKQFGISSNDQLFDPLTNLKAAFQVSGGGQNFAPWSAYKKGLHSQYLDEVEAAILRDMQEEQAPTQPTTPTEEEEDDE